MVWKMTPTVLMKLPGEMKLTDEWVILALRMNITTLFGAVRHSEIRILSGDYYGRWLRPHHPHIGKDSHRSVALSLEVGRTVRFEKEAHISPVLRLSEENTYSVVSCELFDAFICLFR